MKKVIFASASVVVSFILFSFVSAAPGPWGIAINEKTHECGGFWGGDEFTILVLPAGWEDIYSWSDNWTKMGNVSECYLNGEPGPYQTNDSKICCEKNGYKFISKNAGIESNSSCNSLYWFDNTNKSCGQKEFCGAYMYYGLQTFENKTACETAAGINKSCIEEGEKSYGEASVVYPCCPGLKNINVIDDEGKMAYDVAYCTNCGNGDCKKPENKYNCPQDCGNCPANSENENGKCMFNLSNGRKAEIKIMPETASQNAIDRLGELNFTVQLKEVGKGLNVKPVYELTGNKQGKFLGIFKIMARVQAQVDAGTGDTKVIKPWWSFLASGV